MIALARKRGGAEDEGANWMDTYGDMITLVLTFFVLLYSMSSMDSNKWQYIAEAFSQGNFADEPTVQVVGNANEDNDPSAIYNSIASDNKDSKVVDFEDFYKYLEDVITENNLGGSVSVEMSDTGVYMRFRDNVFFDGDSDELRDEGKYVLDVICDGIKDVSEQVYAIKVSGYTASSNNSKADEWELSSGRANSVIKYMLSLDACDPEKFSSAGYGKNRPLESNDTEEGRRQNRRVEIVFIRNDVDFSDPNVISELLELEFGQGFVQYADADGNTVETSAQTEAETSAADNTDKVYVSKEDAISGAAK